MLTTHRESLTLLFDVNNSCEFDYIWLRDNCPCEDCFHPITGEKLLDTTEIHDNIAPLASYIIGNKLSIMWNDRQHQSNYDLDWLKKRSLFKKQANNTAELEINELQLWGNEIENKLPTFEYQDLRNENTALLQCCEAIRDTGVAIVHNSPTEKREVEKFAEYIGCVRETIFDRVLEIQATPNELIPNSVATSNQELKPQTDFASYNNPPAIQMLHFLTNNAEGGDSTLVDGFNVAKKLKEKHPNAYQVLAETAVPFRVNNCVGDITSANPLLTLDTNGELKVFRFSNQTIQPLSFEPKKMREFYRAYRLLGQLIEDPNNTVKLRLNAGDMMLTNNLRVIRGRTAYKAKDPLDRHLQVAYMDYDDLISRIRMIKSSMA